MFPKRIRQVLAGIKGSQNTKTHSSGNSTCKTAASDGLLTTNTSADTEGRKDTLSKRPCWGCSTALMVCLGRCPDTVHRSPLYWEKAGKHQCPVPSTCLCPAGFPCACPLLALWDGWWVYLPLFLLGCGGWAACCGLFGVARQHTQSNTGSEVHLSIDSPGQDFHCRHSGYCCPVIILLCELWSLGRGFSP